MTAARILTEAATGTRAFPARQRAVLDRRAGCPARTAAATCAIVAEFTVRPR